MILSEYVRVMDLNWLDFIWGAFWIILLLGTLIAVVYSSGWAAGRKSLVKNDLPNMYNGKLKLSQLENKELKAENRQLLHQLNNKTDMLRVVKKAVEV